MDYQRATVLPDYNDPAIKARYEYKAKQAVSDFWASWAMSTGPLEPYLDRMDPALHPTLDFILQEIYEAGYRGDQRPTQLYRILGREKEGFMLNFTRFAGEVKAHLQRVNGECDRLEKLPAYANKSIDEVGAVAEMRVLRDGPVWGYVAPEPEVMESTERAKF